MQLNNDMMERFGAGRFQDFLDKGAAELQVVFAMRFAAFTDPGAAHDAARQIVGESYEFARDLGRPSGLLSMRIAFLRAAFGRGVLEDPRFVRAQEMVKAQVEAATITEDRSVAAYLSDLRPYWEAPAFSRSADARHTLLERLDATQDDWPAVLSHLHASHASSDLEAEETVLRAFINQAFRDGMTLGLETNEAIRLYVLVADALGLQFYADSLLPEWERLFRDGDQHQILAALKRACSGGDR